jgi:hypothetical protein
MNVSYGDEDDSNILVQTSLTNLCGRYSEKENEQSFVNILTVVIDSQKDDNNHRD